MAIIVLGENKAFLGDIFGWWYSQGIRDFFIYLKALFLKITDIFSVKLLLRTYLSPWKRDITSTKGLPLNQVFQVILFNLTSRLIGFIIKTIILFIYLIVLIIFFVVSLSLILIWLFLPLITILGIIYGIQLFF